MASQTSAQSRSRRMHRVSICTSCLPRQASAQAVQAWAQSKQASMHSTSAVVSKAAPLGFASIICRAWVIFLLLTVLFRASPSLLPFSSPAIPLLVPPPYLPDVHLLVLNE